MRQATWLETGLFALAAVGLFWPEYWADLTGFVALVAAVLLQKFYQPQKLNPLPVEADASG